MAVTIHMASDARKTSADSQKENKSVTKTAYVIKM
jgi:hypothetical protein